jgi:hypothetical protein
MKIVLGVLLAILILLLALCIYEYCFLSRQYADLHAVNTNLINQISDSNYKILLLEKISRDSIYRIREQKKEKELLLELLNEYENKRFKK